MYAVATTANLQLGAGAGAGAEAPLRGAISMNKNKNVNVNVRSRGNDWGLFGSVRHWDEVYPMARLKLATVMAAEKEKQMQIPPHWRFCYSLVHQMAVSFVAAEQIMDKDLRDAIYISILVLRALDTIEDDSTLTTEMKVSILQTFHHHIRDGKLRFSNDTQDYKILKEKFHHVTTAFLELDYRYQKEIEEIAMRMGAGMAKFICKEVDTIDDYDEYCHYVSGLCIIGTSKIYSTCKGKDLASDDLSNTIGLFYQKADIIKDYLVDINDTPRPRIFWPRQIWGKYVDNLEDLKKEENSAKALLCLNEMVTNALTHVEDSLKYLSALPDPAIFRSLAIWMVLEFGALALCYDNIQVFRRGAKLRLGLKAKIFYTTRTMFDVYEAVYNFSLTLESKINQNNSHCKEAKNLVDTIKKLCENCGTSNKRSYII
ncbi:squalene synthase 8-like isoform X2 [Andrographis paniculata]|uniref:squalene synthase 8-like isoform X2 n=1 Tax=Andrographis paniculata TaxID=175694 RepID=UPI0021E7A1AF|nr:squalene synthase 8-like isoform X2 [Andrographis paniculata]